MHYLGSNSCHVIVSHIFLMKYICIYFLRQLTLKQLIIPEYHMGVYHKRGSKANGKTSIFNVSHDYAKKLCLKENNDFLANVIFGLNNILFK